MGQGSGEGVEDCARLYSIQSSWFKLKELKKPFLPITCMPILGFVSCILSRSQHW